MSDSKMLTLWNVPGWAGMGTLLGYWTYPQGYLDLGLDTCLGILPGYLSGTDQDNLDKR